MYTTLSFAGLLLSVLATGIEPLARQTSPVELDGQAVVQRAPKATPPPQARWAGVNADVLLGRQESVGSNTCGFFTVSPYKAFVCSGEDFICTTSGNLRGCCVSDECTSSTAFFTTCFDSSSTECTISGAVSQNTLCCTSDVYSNCVTYIWSTTTAPGLEFTQYNCDVHRYSGEYFLAAEIPSTSTISTSSSSISNSSSLSPTQSPTTSSNNIGAIVGGAVGGVAVLSLITFGIWFFLRKKKKQQIAQPMAQSHMAQPTDYSSPPPPGTPSYDPRYAYTGIPSQTSPTTQGYPSPAASPAPLYAEQQPAQGCELWQNQGLHGFASQEKSKGYVTSGYQEAESPAEVDGESSVRRTSELP